MRTSAVGVLHRLAPAHRASEPEAVAMSLVVEAVDPGTWMALLPSLDPTTMGWKERSWYLGELGPRLFDRNGNAGPTIWLSGRIVGGWAQRQTGEVATRLLVDVGREAIAAIEAEAARLQAWLDASGAIVKPHQVHGSGGNLPTRLGSTRSRTQAPDLHFESARLRPPWSAKVGTPRAWVSHASATPWLPHAGSRQTGRCRTCCPVRDSSGVTIRATFELEPAGSAEELAEELASGLAIVSCSGRRRTEPWAASTPPWKRVVKALAARSGPARPA